MADQKNVFILYTDAVIDASQLNQQWGSSSKYIQGNGDIYLLTKDKKEVQQLKCVVENQVEVITADSLRKVGEMATGHMYLLPMANMQSAKSLLSAELEEEVALFQRNENGGGIKAALTNLLTGNRWPDEMLGAIAFTHTLFTELIATHKFKAELPRKTMHKLLKAAADKGFEPQEVEISTKVHDRKLPGLMSTKLMGCSLWLDDMWTQPLYQLKSSRQMPIWSQHHPIHKLLFTALAGVFAVLMPIMALSFGINWDEVEIINYTNDVLNYYLSLGEDRTALDGQKRLYTEFVFYGLSFDTFLAFVNRFLSPFGVYETRHMITAFCGFIGVFFIGLTAKELASWRAALIGLVMAFLSPYYLGHAMTNTKDIPFAVFYIVAVYFVIRIVRRLPSKVHFRDLFFFGLALAAIISIRVGGILVLAYLGMFAGLSWLAIVQKERFSKALKYVPRYAAYVLGVGIAGYVLGIFLWPYALENPIEGPKTALSQFTKFSFLTIYELFEGQRIYMGDVPWYYIPKFLLIGNPLHAVIGFIIGVVMLMINRKQVYAWGGVILLFTLVFPVAYAAYKESTLYNGWRHFLFVYPPMAVVAAVGWDQLMEAVKKKPLKIAVNVVLLALFGLTSIWTIRNHPNEYVYYNQFVGTHAGAYGNYESDPYGHVVREGVEWMVENELPAQPTEKIYITTNFDVSSGQYFLNKYHDSVKFVWAREHERYSKLSDYMLIGPRTFSKAQMNNGGFPPKGTIHTIDVDGKPILAIVKIENKELLEAHNDFRTNQFQQAIAHLEAYVQYDSQNEEAWRMLGASYLNIGQLDKAENALNKAIELFPESYIAHYYRGFLMLQNNDLNGAVQSYETSLKHKINYSMNYAQLANVFFQSRNYAKSLEWYYGYLFDQANMNSAFWKLKNAKRTKLNEYEEALEGNISINTSPQVLNGVATCWLALNNADQAITYFNYTLSVDKNYMPAYQGMAEAYKQKGDNATAQQYMQAAQQLSKQ